MTTWIMCPLIWVLLLGVGSCESVYWQKLTCPFDLKYKHLPRVWCRQSSTDCCTGLIFSQSAQSVDGGNLRVTQRSDSFTVATLEPGFGGGMYWCGVLSNNTVIKLAEGYFQSSSASYIWSYTRWMLLPLLPIVTICTNIYSSRKSFSCCAESGGARLTSL